MIDFSTVQGLTIPEGVVTRIDDTSCRLLWTAGVPVVLEVEKQTHTTYVGGTKYSSESFVLLNIYPKNSNSIVNVTYGGLTKTLNFSEKTPQQVYFGKFNGVSDDVETPASGTLIIEGGYEAFGIGRFQDSSSFNHCDCITAIMDCGTSNYIPNQAFQGCSNLTFVELSTSVTSIGERAFESCRNLESITITDSVTSIGEYAFYGCSSLTLIELPSGLTSISECAFSGCYNINIRVIPEGVTSIDFGAFMMGDTQQFAMWEADITLPSTLRSMDITSFVVEICPDDSSNWEMLWYPKSLTILAVEPPALDCSYYSTKIGNLSRITVPKGCGDAYKTAEGWNLYADIIVEASE